MFGKNKNDGTETAFALFLISKIFLSASEDSVDFMCGGGGPLADELYNGNENTN